MHYPTLDLVFIVIQRIHEFAFTPWLVENCKCKYAAASIKYNKGLVSPRRWIITRLISSLLHDPVVPVHLPNSPWRGSSVGPSFMAKGHPPL